MNILDIVAIVLLLIITVISAKKGFMMSLFNIVGYVVSAILSKTLSVPVSSYVYTNYFSEGILGKLNELIPSGSVQGEISEVINNVIASLPEYVQSMISQFELTDLLVPAETGALTVEMIEQSYIAPIMLKIISVVAVVVLFIAISFVLRLVFSIINKLFVSKKHNIIRKTNMFLGAVLGVIKGAVVSGVLCAVLSVVAPIINNPTVTEFVTGSTICNFVADLLK